ncbi:MAG: hypothetical protein OES20_09325 [Gammaproteobacteria bacterium]|nr:hypothetical protein [Gammaproteobacteria bacterium]
MRTGLYLLLLGLGLILQPAAAGDRLTIPGHVPVTSKQMMPKRGIKMDDVLSEFGEPDQRFGPVGEPPITEWVYGSFRVYFEYQIVLHTVDLNTIIMPK